MMQMYIPALVAPCTKYKYFNE